MENRNLYLIGAVVLIALAIAAIEIINPQAQTPTTTVPVSLPAAGAQAGGIIPRGPPAPELARISGYINSDPNLTIASLRGKVVLVDFWAYSCINCQRTLPYIVSWDQKYRGKGLVIIGVHTPEFDFEKDISNVQRAVQKAGIMYPVVLDNDGGTWNAYRNSYWPHDYLINKDGYIVHDHIGEGGYDQTEQEIVQLLGEISPNATMNETNVSAPAVDFGKIGTPEIYFGYLFARQPIGNQPQFSAHGGIDNYTLPDYMVQNTAYFNGSWQNNPDQLQLASNDGKVSLKYSSKSVNIVASSSNPQGSQLEIYVDGRPAMKSEYGADADANGKINVTDSRLYNVLSAPDYGDHEIEIRVHGPGFMIYTFTFG